MKKTTLKRKGFTLYELVVVVGIILLLVSIVLSRLDIARAKARDIKKISELKTLQTALELYRSDIGSYPQQFQGQPARNSENFSTMSVVLQGIVGSGYLSLIPKPPKGVPDGPGEFGGTIYYYQTSDITNANPNNEYIPSCDGKRLGDVPYIIYFVTETPNNLPKLSNRGLPITNGHCLTL